MPFFAVGCIFQAADTSSAIDLPCSHPSMQQNTKLSILIGQFAKIEIVEFFVFEGGGEVRAML